MQKIVFTILVLFATNNLFAQLDLLKWSTIYTSVSINNALFMQGNWQMVEGDLVNLTRENPHDFTIAVGIRKLARFKYQSKPGNFYDGTEKYISDNSIIGAVNGLEYKAQVELKRQQGREFENRHISLRYIGDFYTIKAEQRFNGLADIKYSNLDTRLRLKIGNKINLTAGVMNSWRPLGYEYNAIQKYIDDGNMWWQLAYDYGYEDQYFYIDGNQNGQDDWFDYYDWNWFNEDGVQIAQSDYEFYKYHFGKVVREYTLDVQDSLGMVREMSLAFGSSFYHYGDRFWLHAFADMYPKRWLQDNVAEQTLRYIELEQDRIDYTIGFVLGTKLGNKKRLGLFIEGDYNDMWGREWYNLKAGINYLFF
jgi:hypothetical protein